jgi:hypothetical protein
MNTIKVRAVVRRNDPIDRAKLGTTLVLGGITGWHVRFASGRVGPVVSFPVRQDGDCWIPCVILHDHLNEAVARVVLPLLSTLSTLVQ